MITVCGWIKEGKYFCCVYGIVYECFYLNQIYFSNTGCWWVICYFPGPAKDDWERHSYWE